MSLCRSSRRCLELASVAVMLVGSVLAEEQPPNGSKLSERDITFFEAKVRPLLISHCLECHGKDSDDIQGGLDLTTRAGMVRGGDTGTLHKFDSPNENLLLRAVRYDTIEMPPDGKLTSEDVAVFEEWVRRRLPDPRDAKSSAPRKKMIDIDQGREFWAFKRPQKPPVPVVLDADWPWSDIDRFVLANQEKAGVTPVQDATRSVLVRRVYLTLTGLPPSLEQVAQFVNDSRSDEDALALLVDQLLASVHFGERWGRHWLDVARFAESSGGGRSLMFRNAWRYRDYVIDAFNQDKPFDEFVVEQLAGDLLMLQDPNVSRELEIHRRVATGFLVLGPTNYEQQDKELLRMEVIDEQIDTMGRAFLGLSLGCARCHDHKFDPIPTKDYYALAGIFGSTQTLVNANVSSFVKADLPPTDEEAAELRAYDQETQALNEKLAKLHQTIRELGHGHLLAAVKPKNKKSVPAATLAGIVIDDSEAIFEGEWTASTFSPGFVAAGYVHDDGKGKGLKAATFRVELATGEHEVLLAYTAGSNRARQVPVTVNFANGIKTVTIDQKRKPNRGSFVSLGTYAFENGSPATVRVDTVGTEGVVIVDAVQFLPTEATSSVKKLRKTQVPNFDTLAEAKAMVAEAKTLAKAIDKRAASSPDKHRFAMSVKDVSKPVDGHIHIRGEIRNLGPVVPRGFVSVALPKGWTQQIPAKQSGRLELANWVASKENPLTARVYVNRVWKHLFGRGIVATVDNHGLMGERPENLALLDFLATEFVENGWSTKSLIRSVMLSRTYLLASLDDACNAAKDPENRSLWRANRRRLDAEVIRDSILSLSGDLDLAVGGSTIDPYSTYDWGYRFEGFRRRSVYVPLFRNALLEILDVFDFTNPNLVTGSRTPSTLPTQALYLMNSPFVRQQAIKIAKRIVGESAGESQDQRLERGYRQVLGRKPNHAQLALLRGYLDDFVPEDPSVDDSLEAWASLCHAWLASVEFRYLD